MPRLSLYCLFKTLYEEEYFYRACPYAEVCIRITVTAGVAIVSDGVWSADGVLEKLEAGKVITMTVIPKSFLSILTDADVAGN